MAENDRSQETADADEPRGLAVAVLSFIGHVLGTVLCAALAAWFIAEAVQAPGPMWSRVVFGGVGVAVGVGGLALGVRGVRWFVRWARSDAYHRHVERRARQLGLPTDPEAYQDGGLAVAATAPNLNEAEVLALALNQAGIPAWVPDRATAGWYWHMQYAISPRGMRVMVPLGRLEDAQQVLAEHDNVTPPPAAETADALDAGSPEALDPEAAAADASAERLFKRAKGLLVVLLISITLTSPYVLPASLWVFSGAWAGFKETRRPTFKRVMAWSAVTGAIAFLMLIVLVMFLAPALG